MHFIKNFYPLVVGHSHAKMGPVPFADDVWWFAYQRWSFSSSRNKIPPWPMGFNTTSCLRMDMCQGSVRSFGRNPALAWMAYVLKARINWWFLSQYSNIFKIIGGWSFFFMDLRCGGCECFPNQRKRWKMIRKWLKNSPVIFLLLTRHREYPRMDSEVVSFN